MLWRVASHVSASVDDFGEGVRSVKDTLEGVRYARVLRNTAVAVAQVT
jgi:hypothetical protein